MRKMQSHNKLVVCAFIIIVALIPYGLCIKCWSCRSSYDPACGNPFDNSTLPLTDCKYVKDAHVPGLCTKISRKVNGQWIYSRDCASFNESENDNSDGKSCITKTDSDGFLTEYCTCNDKDGCNSSFNFTPTKMLICSLAFLCSLLAVKKLVFKNAN